MPWCSAEVVLNVIGAMIGKAPSTLSDSWTAVVGLALETAENDIRSALHKLGYDDAQLDAWDSRAARLKKQAAYEAILTSTVRTNVDPDRLAALNQLPALADGFVITIGGVPVAPTPGATGGITHGTITAADTTRSDFDPNHLFT